MTEALGLWERFLNERDTMPALVQCALMHEHFEAIHPFLDGNGRVGRLLITLFLVERRALVTTAALPLGVHRRPPERLLRRAPPGADRRRLARLAAVLPRRGRSRRRSAQPSKRLR